MSVIWPSLIGVSQHIRLYSPHVKWLKKPNVLLPDHSNTSNDNKESLAHHPDKIVSSPRQGWTSHQVLSMISSFSKYFEVFCLFYCQSSVLHPWIIVMERSNRRLSPVSLIPQILVLCFQQNFFIWHAIFVFNVHIQYLSCHECPLPNVADMPSNLSISFSYYLTTEL